MFRVQGLGFTVWEFEVTGLGFSGLRFRAQVHGMAEANV